MAFVKISEQSSLYNDLEKKPVREILEEINTEDHKVADAVQKAIPNIEKLVEGIVERMKKGGRIFYIGAGTSGRLGVLDASEIPPTFGMDPSWVIGVIAGGAQRGGKCRGRYRAGVEGLGEIQHQFQGHAYRYSRFGYYALRYRRIEDSACQRTSYGCHHEQSRRSCFRGCGDSYRDGGRSGICNRKLAYEVGYRTEDDMQYDYHFGDDQDGTCERQQDGEHAADQRQIG